MNWTEGDLIQSLMKKPQYVEEILAEMLPDDTKWLLGGTRKGKSKDINMDKLMGGSNVDAREKAHQSKLKAAQF